MDISLPEEQYETDTIFSQEGDVSDNYLSSKLRDVESEHVFDTDHVPSDSLKNLPESGNVHQSYLHMDLPTPTGVGKSFEEIVKESHSSFLDYSSAGDYNIIFGSDEYDLGQDSFRYGRVTDGISFNVLTGKMPEEIVESVKRRDEENDKYLENNFEKKSPHFTISEASITLSSEKDESGPLNNSLKSGFINLYEQQMPRYFEYGQPFPEVNNIWTILFDQSSYLKMTTFEIQAAICAALNSKRYMMFCVGIDGYNSVTGVELSPSERVTFRLALTRAVAGEFQPPLIKVPPKHLNGISPLKQDVSNFTPSIDVLFIPVFKDDVSSSENLERRFLIVIRVKDISPKMYQLSSGRIYVEENGQIVELSCLHEAFRILVAKKKPEDEEDKGSFFMLESDDFCDVVASSSGNVESTRKTKSDVYDIFSNSVIETTFAGDVKNRINSQIMSTSGRWVEIRERVSSKGTLAAMAGFIFMYGIYRVARNSC